MPTYDYACRACGRRFERFESIHDDASKACPKCGKKRARRMLGAGAGLIFKGDGFYTTDSRKPAGGSGEGRKPSGGTDKGGTDKKAESSGEKKKEEKESKK